MFYAVESMDGFLIIRRGASVIQVADDVPDNEYVFEGALSRQREHATVLERFPPDF